MMPLHRFSRRTANEELSNSFKEEVKHTYQWTVSDDIQDIIRSPVFVTQNNTKWSLKLDLRYTKYRKSIIGFHLILEDCKQQEVDIKFNLFQIKFDDFQGTQEFLSIFSKQTKLKPNEVLRHSVGFDEYFKHNENIMLYFELIHTRSQPNISEKVGNNLTENFKSLLISEEFSDIKIVVKGKEFTAHKCVLSARSQVFAAMFGSDMKEKLENKVEINDIEVDVFEQLLSFIYTGSAPKLEEFVEELLICSEFYGLNDLKSVCEEIFCQNFTIESSIDLLLFAIKYNASYLKERLIHFIADNYLEIEVKSYNSLSDLFRKEPKLMETIVHRMAKLVVKQI